MNNLETIKVIAQSLRATTNPDTTYGKAIADAISMAVRIVESAQNIEKNQDHYNQLAIDTWNLVYLFAENTRQNMGKIPERRYGELVKVLEDILKVFSIEEAAECSPGQGTPDTEMDVVGELRQKLFQFLEQFGFASFAEVKQRADEDVIRLLAGTTKIVNIGDNTNLSQSRGNVIGFNNAVTNTFTNNGLIANNNGSDNKNINLRGNSNEVHTGGDYRQYHGPIINNQADSTKDDEILNRLRRAPAQYTSFKGEGGCMRGTRTSVLEQAMTWASGLNPDDPPIFWLYGPAGTGKSTIAYSVAEQCSELSNHICASFFFTHTNGDCSDANLFFTTIAYQLANLNPELKTHIVNRIKKHVKPEDIRPDIQLDDLIIRPLSDLGVQTPIVIVVDALDECSDARAASEILRLVSSRISKLPFRLKFFITSRPEPPIRASMESDLRPSTRPFNMSQDVDPSLTDSDIRQFLENRLREGVVNMFGDEISWLGEKEIDALVHQSGGLFIYASTVVKVILDSNVKDPRAKVEALLSMDPPPGLGAVDALYLRVLCNALPEDADEALKYKFQLILGGIIVVRETLSPRMLETLLGLEAGAIRRILSGLHSVIAIPDNDDEVIHTIHPSFPRYLTNRKSLADANARFFIDPAIYHAHLAKFCFQHMKTFLKRNVCGFDDLSRIDLEVEDEERSKHISQRITGVVKYACLHFAPHLYATDITFGGLDELLADWAHHRLLYWLEVLVLLGSLGIVLPSLALLSEWLKLVEARTRENCTGEDMPHPVTKFFRHLLSSPHPRMKPNNKDQSSSAADRNTQSLLRDAARMVSEFFDTIRYIPSQIYTSCIAFAPTTSAFYGSHSAKCTDMRLILGSSPNWSAITVLHTFNFDALGLAFSSDGRILASSLKDDTLRLWNLGTGECQVLDREMEEDNKFIAFSPCDRYIAASNQVYEAATGRKILRQAAHIAFSPNGKSVALSSEDGSIDLHDLEDHTCVSQISGHKGPLTSMIFSPDSKWLVSASSDNTLRIRSIEEPKEDMSISRKESMRHPHSLAFSPNGAYLAFCDDDQIRIWVMAERAEQKPSHTWDVIRMFQQPVFSPDSRIIAWVTEKQDIEAVQLDRVDKKPWRHKFRNYYSVAFSLSGKTILASDFGGGFFLLHVGVESKRAVKRVHSGGGGGAIDIISSPSGRYYASQAPGKRIHVWEVDEEASPPTLTNHFTQFAVFAPDGKSIAVFERSGYVSKLDTLTGQCVLRWLASGTPLSIEFSSDRRYLAIQNYGTSSDICTEFWLWDTGRRFKPPTPHSGATVGYAFSRDAAYIALCYDSRKLYLVNLRQRAKPIPLDNADVISPSTIQFSPNGRHVASVAWSGHIMVWDVATGKLHARAQSESLNEEFSFSPDGRHIAYSGRKGIYVWDFSGGGSKRRIVYRSPVGRLSFSPLDQRYIAAATSAYSDDARAILIDTEMQDKVTETNKFSSYHAFMRAFRRKGRFLNYPSSSSEARQVEDKCNYPCIVDKEGWVRTATSRPLCRLPRAAGSDGFRRLKYDTNGNRIVLVIEGKVILIQFGAEAICEDHPPLLE